MTVLYCIAKAKANLSGAEEVDGNTVDFITDTLLEYFGTETFSLSESLSQLIDSDLGNETINLSDGIIPLRIISLYLSETLNIGEVLALILETNLNETITLSEVFQLFCEFFKVEPLSMGDRGKPKIDETESWITVLCEKCGMEVHNFIAEQLQAKHL